eukprot:363764-Chlamydomonas_euryale.AAC.16
MAEQCQSGQERSFSQVQVGWKHEPNIQALCQPAAAASSVPRHRPLRQIRLRHRMSRLPCDPLRSLTAMSRGRRLCWLSRVLATTALAWFVVGRFMSPPSKAKRRLEHPARSRLRLRDAPGRVRDGSEWSDKARRRARRTRSLIERRKARARCGVRRRPPRAGGPRMGGRWLSHALWLCGRCACFSWCGHFRGRPQWADTCLSLSSTCSA